MSLQLLSSLAVFRVTATIRGLLFVTLRIPFRFRVSSSSTQTYTSSLDDAVNNRDSVPSHPVALECCKGTVGNDIADTCVHTCSYRSYYS